MKCVKIPCPECPFSKKSIKGYLGGVYETPNELHSLVMNEFPFPCHTAQEDFVKWNDAGNDKNPLCAGALMYMRKSAKSPRNPELNKLVKDVDTTKLDNILSVPEFHEHHKEVLV